MFTGKKTLIIRFMKGLHKTNVMQIIEYSVHYFFSNGWKKLWPFFPGQDGFCVVVLVVVYDHCKVIMMMMIILKK